MPCGHPVGTLWAGALRARARGQRPSAAREYNESTTFISSVWMPIPPTLQIVFLSLKKEKERYNLFYLFKLLNVIY